MVVCLERGPDLHMAQLMLLPLTVSCFSKIQIGFSFLVPAYPVVPEKGPLNVCVCVCIYLDTNIWILLLACCSPFLTSLSVLHEEMRPECDFPWYS